MASTKTKGNTGFRERPDSPEWDFSTQKTTCVRTYEGLYADILRQAALLKMGASMADLNAPTLLIENVKIKKAVSGKATLTVTLEVDVATPDNSEPVQPVFEVEWSVLERVIEQNPFFAPLFPDPTGQTTFSTAQITDLNLFTTWDNATDAAAKQAAYDKLSDGFKKLALKKMRGTTTYFLFGPVARITTLSRNVTLANVCGLIFNAVPNFSELPTGYKWLSTSDRSTRTGKYGKWQRVQEWTGADSWDKDLYTPRMTVNGATGGSGGDSGSGVDNSGGSGSGSDGGGSST